MSNYYIFHLFHHLGECAIYNYKILLQSLQSLPYFPLFHLGFFKTFVESHGLLNLIVFEQTQDMHYSSPIPVYALHSQGDQYNVQLTPAHIILCPADVLTPRKVIGFFFHKTVSHPSLSWLMHEVVLQVIYPWNPHALKNTLLHFFFVITKCKERAIFSITWLGKVCSTFMNKPWCLILDKHACQVLLGCFICLAIGDYVYWCQLHHKDCFQIQLDFI